MLFVLDPVYAGQECWKALRTGCLQSRLTNELTNKLKNNTLRTTEWVFNEGEVKFSEGEVKFSEGEVNIH